MPRNESRILLTTPIRRAVRRRQHQYLLDVYASRLTRHQGPFTASGRSFTTSIHLIAQNLPVPTTVLEWPTLGELLTELSKGYDYLGISFVTMSLPAVFEICRTVKRRFPRVKIILGGHGAMGLQGGIRCGRELLQLVDHVCIGEGIQFMCDLLRVPPPEVLKQEIPPVRISLFGLDQDHCTFQIGILVRGVGCSNACKFCSTSAFFKHKHIVLASPDDIFRAMKNNLRKNPRIRSHWIYDENLLGDRRFVTSLGKLIRTDREFEPTRFAWGTFGDAQSVRQYTPGELLRAQINTVWLGLESTRMRFAKKDDADVREVVRGLNQAGITTVVSFIVGFDEQNPENIQQDVEYLLSIPASAIQVAPLVPLPCTRLMSELAEAGRLICPDDPEQYHIRSFVHKHPSFARQEVLDLIDRIYRESYRLNGPYPTRILETYLNGFLNFSDRPEDVGTSRGRFFERQCRSLAPVLLAATVLAPSSTVRKKLQALQARHTAVFGTPHWRDRLLSLAILLMALKEKARRALISKLRLKLGTSKFHYPGNGRRTQSFPEESDFRPRPVTASLHV